MSTAPSNNAMEEMVDPIPRPKSVGFTVNMQPKVREVVFVTNEKPNAVHVLRGAQAELRRRGIAVREKILFRPLTHGPVTDGEFFEQLSQERGLLLDGVND